MYFSLYLNIEHFPRAQKMLLKFFIFLTNFGIAFLTLSSSCPAEKNYFKLTAASEYIDKGVLSSVKFAFDDWHSTMTPTIYDCASIALGYQTNKPKDLFYSVNLIKNISTFDDVEKKHLTEVELLNWKQNYGDYKTSLKIFSMAYGLDMSLYDQSVCGGGYDEKTGVWDSWDSPPHIRLLLRAGFSSEYSSLKSLPDNQKWYFSPTIATGVTAWFSDFSAIVRVQVGLMKAESTNEIVTWLGKKKDIDLRLFYNSEYFYPQGSSRNKYLQSAGIKVGYVW